MVLGSMVCPSFVLGGDANTGSAGYVCLEVELMGWESEFYAAMLAAFAFAAFLGLPSFFAVVCPGAATLFLGEMMYVCCVRLCCVDGLALVLCSG